MPPKGVNTSDSEVSEESFSEEDVEDFEQPLSSEEDESDAESETDETLRRNAWGKKAAYYSADFKEGELSEEEEDEIAKEEEEEARRLQSEQRKLLSSADFDIGEGSEGEESEEETSTIQKDPSLLSKDEKLQMLSKDTPELLKLLEECKTIIPDIQKTLLPIIQRCFEAFVDDKTLKLFRAQRKEIATSKGISFLEMKFRKSLFFNKSYIAMVCNAKQIFSSSIVLILFSFCFLKQRGNR